MSVEEGYQLDSNKHLITKQKSCLQVEIGLEEPNALKNSLTKKKIEKTYFTNLI